MIINDKQNFKFQLSGKTLVIIDWANVYGWFSDPRSKNYLGWEIDVKKLFDHLSIYPEIYDKRLYQGIENGNKRSESFGIEAKSIGYNLISKEVKWVPVSLDKSHFKKVIKELFDVLDGIKNTNSDIATRLYELKGKIEDRLSSYELIEGLDLELKKLNIGIDDLQKHLSEPVLRRKCDFDVEIARDIFNMSADFNQLILFSGDGDFSALVDDLTIKGKKVIVVFAQGHKGKEYKNQKGLFLCTVENLKANICAENNIPTDFSAGRDSPILAGTNNESQALVDNN
jgi:uncharacterized LabA/DUF88 family protein